MTTETLPLPPVPPSAHGPRRLPRPGTYTAETGRCIVELTARYGPFVTLRRRLTTSDAALTVPADADGCALRLELTGGPLGRSVLVFESDCGEPAADGSRLVCPGQLTLRGKPLPTDLPLRVVDCTAERLLVTGTTQVPYRLLRAATGFALPHTRPADRLRLLVAAEFT
ncbi:hypothetical protein ACFYXH_13020 [Streptomyces sp. NPDC002730]|uniref:hypothetical protein n=1 Tax=Streptomyces sp. NPDC002730 TaxID=3364662 RepID=UPI0036831E18